MGWRLGRLLGQGAFGRVYLAQSTELLGRRRAADVPYVAVKIALGPNSSTLHHEKTVYEEIGESRFILKFEGSDRIQNQYCIVVEYAPRGTLNNLHRQRISEGRASCYAEMILKGLSRVHEHGWVHCDLKPDNILAFPSRNQAIDVRLKLSDFGRAKRRGVHSSALRGTLLYSSPESVQYGQHERPSDIWSLGCILYWLLTGSGLWDRYVHGNTQLLKTMIEGFDENMLVLPPYLSHTAKSFLKKCLRYDPARRWGVDALLQHPFVPSNW
ncbi:hypothetical protein AgCh_003218 [Apium graveolens]